MLVLMRTENTFVSVIIFCVENQYVLSQVFWLVEDEEVYGQKVPDI